MEPEDWDPDRDGAWMAPPCPECGRSVMEPHLDTCPTVIEKRIGQARGEAYDEGYRKGKEGEHLEAPELRERVNEAYDLGKRAGYAHLEAFRNRIRRDLEIEFVAALHAGGIPQVELAKALGVHQSTVSRMLNPRLAGR